MNRRWILWLLIIAFVWVVVSRFTEIEKIAQILAQGDWIWVLIAASVQVLFYLVDAWLYQSAFDTVEVRSSIRDLIPLIFSALFISVAAPIGGISGTTVYIENSIRNDESGPRTAVGAFLVIILDFCSFLLILFLGLAYLLIRNKVEIYEIIGAIIMVLLFLSLSGILLIGLWNPGTLLKILLSIQRMINAIARLFKRPHPFQDEWAKETSEEMAEGVMAITANPGKLLRSLGIALLAHLARLTVLGCVFIAFRQQINLGVLIAGYAMGLLFWIISITPSGIGVVEGVMALVFASLGIPTERGTVISLAFRGLTFWLPLAIGFILVRRLQAFKTTEGTRSDSWSVRIAAILTGLMGAINVLSAITPSMHNRLRILEQFSPFYIQRGGRLTAVLAGFALLLLATSLWRRKRVAWMLTLVVLAISMVSHLVKGLDYEESFLALALMAWLAYLRPNFHARSDPPSIQQGLRTLGIALGFTIAYGAIGFYILDTHFKVKFSLVNALRQTVVMFAEFYDPGLVPVTQHGRFFADSIYIVGAFTIGYAFLRLAQPVLMHAPATQEQRQHAKSIVEAFGCSSIARFTLFTDKYYYFSPGGSVIAFAHEGRIALTCGDPIGPPEDFEPSLAAFKAYCSANDWLPAYYLVLPDHLRQYQEMGYDMLSIGQEAVVELPTFTLAGGENKSLRTTMNKLTRLGYTTTIHEPPLDLELLQELRAISDEWLTKWNTTEMRFATGWFEDDYIRNSRVIVAYDPINQPVAFANVLPEYQLNEITADLMRYRNEAESGIMDFLFVSLLQWAKGQGYSSFSLGLSALAGIGESSEDPAIERALHYIYEHVESIYHFKGLHAFKEKYHPNWLPRYLVYPGPTSLALVTIAIIRADTGDDVLAGYLRHR